MFNKYNTKMCGIFQKLDSWVRFFFFFTKQRANIEQTDTITSKVVVST